MTVGSTGKTRSGRDHARDVVEAARGAMDSAHDAVDQAIERVEEAAGRVAATVKPKLRGWIHVGTAPLALVAGIVLVALTPASDRWASAVFMVASLVLFGTSAVYHRGNWSPRVTQILRRLDHSNIFIMIAGTYTPLTWMLLDRATAQLLLAVVWAGALGGVLLKVFWLSAPRWLYVPLYVALGWVAVWFLPDFWVSGGPAVVALVAAGGIAYTLGAAVYGFKRPNPSPTWFGFHEIFHTGTVIGYVCHLIAVYLAALA